MALWCRDLPTVTVGRSEVPRHVTLIYPFHDNHAFLTEQVRRWCEWPAHVRANVSAIIVDDVSTQPPLPPSARPFPIRGFRLRPPHVRWNWVAARNIGFNEAADGFCLVTDMDHVVPPETAEALVFGVHRPDTVYAFNRREHTGAPIAPHSASFFLTRRLFWTIGGYDERGCGYYGNDGVMRRRIAATTKMALLPEMLERHEFVGDSSTTAYERGERDGGLKRKQALATGSFKVLTYPYDEVWK